VGCDVKNKATDDFKYTTEKNKAVRTHSPGKPINLVAN
jgi:hypothetical protein